jgi:hypothetical protein
VIGVNAYMGIGVAIFSLCFEEGTNADGCLNFAGHNKIIH